MEKDKLIEQMLNEKADNNNRIDLNAYGSGLIDMYDKLTINRKNGIFVICENLTHKSISTSFHYDRLKNQVYLDLQTNAKSELHLYEDGVIRGRYNYTNQIDLSKDVEDLITELCHEFNNALHGRNYCQEGWAELCRSKGITLEMYGL